jgi:molecular chaperone GrpE (heat shock protein)
VNADATFETITNKNTGKDLIYYAAELRKEVSEFYNVCAIIIDQHPIYSYKKPLFRKKADASYDETQINAARKKIKDTAQQLDSMSRKIVKTHADIAGLSKYPTAGQQQVHGLATKFAETISTLVNNLEHEINAIP